MLAARLLAGSRSEARQLIARARAVVDRWERDRSCSQHYISRWRALLAGPVERVARALIEPSDWILEDRFRNTSFLDTAEAERARQALQEDRRWLEGRARRRS